MVRFSRRFIREETPHWFGAYDLGAAETGLTEELAALVREIYTGGEELRSSLKEALEGLGEVADVTILNAMVDRVAAASIPGIGEHPRQPSQLDLPRNEIAEIIAYEAVLQIHAATIPARRIREKEIAGQPARGIDVLSIVDGDPPMLLITEVKASGATDSPPAVVCDGASSLRHQTMRAVNDRGRLIQELNWAHKHCEPEARALVASTLVRLALGQVQLVAAPVLVRPASLHARGDFGCFEDDPSQFAPAAVNFVIVCVPGGIEELASGVYRRAGVRG